MFNASVTHRPLPRAAIAVLATLAMLATLLVGLAPPAFAVAYVGITDGPPDPDNVAQPSFTFEVYDPDADGATCAVDASAPVECTSPWLVPDELVDGEHTFTLQGTFNTSDAGDPVQHVWTVDTVAPTTTFLTMPDDPSNEPFWEITWEADEAGATFELRVDGGDWVDVGTADNASGGASDGDKTVEVRATDAAGNVQDPPTSYTWTTDTVAPTTTISFKPAARTSDTTAAFTFSSDESPDVTFACTIDGSDPAPCTSPTAYEDLADGSHTFTVAATDLAGNTDATPDSWEWVVDSAAPSTSIDSAPEGTVATTDATITFTAEAGSTVECRLDDAAFAPCSSPAVYEDLADGPHTFEAKGTDDVGNVEDPPASATWVVDTTPGDTTIDSSPTALTNDANARFTFSTEDSPATFECSLDGADFGPCPSAPALDQRTAPTTGVACMVCGGTVGSAEYPGLTDGEHTFAVRATDGVGNTDQSPASFTWTVDTAAPNTFITSAPSGTVGSSSASVEFNSPDTSATFECSLDDAPWATCTSPAALSGLADGPHTFRVRALDPAGNADDSPASASWTVDDTDPDTFIDPEFGPTGTVTTRSATFRFVSDDSGATFECKLDAGAFTACTSPRTLTVADGTHTFQVRATDAVGNVDATPDTRTWTVDTVGPTLSIDTGPSGFVTSGVATFTWSAKPAETLTGDQCRLDGGVDGAWTDCPADPREKTYDGLDDGTHLFEVRAKDVNGNVGPIASQSWTIDRSPPNTILTSRPSNGTLTTARITFTATESSTFRCSLDNAAFTACTSPKNLSNLSVGTHTFRVQATDLAGNTDPTPIAASWRVEEAAPEQRFSDVKTSDLFFADINRLAESGVTKGCTKDGARFCPDLNVTRGEMAAFFKRALSLPAGTKVFTDTRGHLFQADIAALERAGITKGCNDARTKFCPDDFVTRGQMAAFFKRALSLPAGTKVFTDTRGHLFQADIAALERAGITKGCNDARTKFCPDEFVTRGQMAAFFNRSGVLDN